MTGYHSMPQATGYTHPTPLPDVPPLGTVAGATDARDVAAAELARRAASQPRPAPEDTRLSVPCEPDKTGRCPRRGRSPFDRQVSRPDVMRGYSRPHDPTWLWETRNGPYRATTGSSVPLTMPLGHIAERERNHGN